MPTVYDLYGNPVLIETGEPITPDVGEPPLPNEPQTTGDAVFDKYGNRLGLVSDGYVEEEIAYFTNGEEILFQISGVGASSVTVEDDTLII